MAARTDFLKNVEPTNEFQREFNRNYLDRSANLLDPFSAGDGNNRARKAASQIDADWRGIERRLNENDSWKIEKKRERKGTVSCFRK